MHCAVLCLTAVCTAQVRASNSYPIEIGRSIAQFSVAEFKLQSQPVKVAYVRGLAGGILGSAVITKDTLKIKPLEKCIGLMDGDALVLIAESYIGLHPEAQGMPMHMIYPVALIGACRSKGIEVQSK